MGACWTSLKRYFMRKSPSSHPPPPIPARRVENPVTYRRPATFQYHVDYAEL